MSANSDLDLDAQLTSNPMRLRETERRLHAVLDNATVAIFLNRAAEVLTGYTLEETQGRPLHDVVHHTRADGSHYPREECPIDRAFPEHHRMQGEEVFVHKDGSFYPVAYTASPTQDDAAKVVGTILEVRDIRAEKEALRRQQLLINELSHRVKNTLAAVQAIAVQSFRSLEGGASAQRIFEGRLRALGEAHVLLTEQNWQGAPLHRIAAQTLAPFGDTRYDLEGPNVQLSPKFALSLAMSLHELASNAANYGALSTDGGKVLIGWTAEDAGEEILLRLRWSERDGPAVEPPTRRGFGTRLVEKDLAREFGGDVRLLFRPEGVTCTMEVRLPADRLAIIDGQVALHR